MAILFDVKRLMFPDKSGFNSSSAIFFLPSLSPPSTLHPLPSTLYPPLFDEWQPPSLRGGWLVGWHALRVAYAKHKQD